MSKANLHNWDKVIEVSKKEDELSLEELRVMVEASEKADKERLEQIRKQSKKMIEDQGILEIKKVVGW